MAVSAMLPMSLPSSSGTITAQSSGPVDTLEALRRDAFLLEGVVDAPATLPQEPNLKVPWPVQLESQMSVWNGLMQKFRLPKPTQVGSSEVQAKTEPTPCEEVMPGEGCSQTEPREAEKPSKGSSQAEPQAVSVQRSSQTEKTVSVQPEKEVDAEGIEGILEVAGDSLPQDPDLLRLCATTIARSLHDLAPWGLPALPSIFLRPLPPSEHNDATTVRFHFAVVPADRRDSPLLAECLAMEAVNNGTCRLLPTLIELLDEQGYGCLSCRLRMQLDTGAPIRSSSTAPAFAAMEGAVVQTGPIEQLSRAPQSPLELGNCTASSLQGLPPLLPLSPTLTAC
eukprot:gnl/TRDRNA2_/TRDRNA2_198867_c0_seq1.p1 gnl/TRDRNA2_/TRDRNA2_198867_c0~~gnl/TRDRNA2_/TRDRNA2_198867_c0_seq1.p1  ORF type:complete len:338 (-),score=50.18 gnl/TRDRNA2_/TRDRNA2_198867_c0_seq1:44-1057(-)